MIYNKPYQRITAITQAKDSLFTAFYDTKNLYFHILHICLKNHEGSPTSIFVINNISNGYELVSRRGLIRGKKGVFKRQEGHVLECN